MCGLVSGRVANSWRRMFSEESLVDPVSDGVASLMEPVKLASDASNHAADGGLGGPWAQLGTERADDSVGGFVGRGPCEWRTLV